MGRSKFLSWGIAIPSRTGLRKKWRYGGPDYPKNERTVSARVC
ncbi:hypothetical protein AcetOrient_orf04666 [Acetobacter orientalis]|uniref:Uncharacterized protein n=1 Tax=Acetobacter orientalis TaxID=146474 RepID=A0A2Z5ZL00_9PROT|nr:hypothetical protein AcetOrient_orf04666 [Acetobacter orientalis]